MNIHVPPDVAKQRQLEMQLRAMQAQQENNFYSVALQVFLRTVDLSIVTEEQAALRARDAIRIAEVFYRTVDAHRQAKAEELSRQTDAGPNNRQ